MLAWPNIFTSKQGFLGKVKGQGVRSTAAIIELMQYSGADLQKQAGLQIRVGKGYFSIDFLEFSFEN